MQPSELFSWRRLLILLLLPLVCLLAVYGSKHEMVQDLLFGSRDANRTYTFNTTVVEEVLVNSPPTPPPAPDYKYHGPRFAPPKNAENKMAMFHDGLPGGPPVEDRCGWHDLTDVNRMAIFAHVQRNMSYVLDRYEFPFMIYTQDMSHVEPNLREWAVPYPARGCFEGSAYLAFILHYYDCLPKYMSFMHDHATADKHMVIAGGFPKHITTNIKDDYPTALKKVCWDNIDDYLPLLRCVANENSPLVRAWLPGFLREWNMTERAKLVEGPNYPLTYHPCGMFIASRSAVRQHSKAWWYNIWATSHSLRGAQKEGCPYVLEVSWDYLLRDARRYDPFTYLFKEWGTFCAGYSPNMPLPGGVLKDFDNIKVRNLLGFTSCYDGGQGFYEDYGHGKFGKTPMPRPSGPDFSPPEYTTESHTVVVSATQAEPADPARTVLAVVLGAVGGVVLPLCCLFVALTMFPKLRKDFADALDESHCCGQ